MLDLLTCKLRKETREQREERSLVASPEDSSSDHVSDSEKEEITMANNRTKRELAAPDLTQQPLCITFPNLNENTHFELKSGLIYLLPCFHGLSNEELHKHLQEFDVVRPRMKPPRITEEQIKLRAFPFSLKDSGKDWLYYILVGSITTWVQLKKKSLVKYLPSLRDTSLTKETCGLKYQPGETVSAYWA